MSLPEFVMMKSSLGLRGVFILMLLLLASCADLEVPEGEVYRAPTTAAKSPLYAPIIVGGGSSSAPEQAASAQESIQAAPTPECTPNLQYLSDVTIPDGSRVAPGEILDKRWQVLNNGTCNWGERYRLKLVAGPDLGAAAEQDLFPARSGSEAELRVVFTAPEEPGPYRSAWQAVSPSGEVFGDPIFIDIVVRRR